MSMPSRIRGDRQAGFSLPELLVSTIILLSVMGAVTGMMAHMSNAHRAVWNRTEMHSAVRGATELLQQEVGQAGLVALPGPITLTGDSALGTQTVAVSTTTGLFIGEQVAIDAGPNQETVFIASIGNGTVTATFALPHAAGAGVTTVGGFATGVVPPTVAHGSTPSRLKLYGDINGDGAMVYVEYTCDTATGRLSRNMMPWAAAAKPALTASMVLLSNIVANPNGTPCFTYQTAAVNGTTYVLDVAITLTVRTQDIDPVTRQFQTETKTLLNVAPRNVLNTWELASIGEANRVQPMPPGILALIAQ